MAVLKSPSKQSVSDNTYRQALLVSGGGAAILVILMLILAKPSPPPTPTASTAGPRAITPTTYTELIGQIKSITDQTVVVSTDITDSNGRLSQKQYSVIVDNQTLLRSARVTQDAPVYRPLKLTDLKVDDYVHATGAENLAPLSSFVAISLSKVEL